jgi:hypothetical protein
MSVRERLTGSLKEALHDVKSISKFRSEEGREKRRKSNWGPKKIGSVTSPSSAVVQVVQ